jgi:hypothetical protein
MKRDDLQRQILVEEEEKHKLQNDMRVLSERLAKVNESLAKKLSARNEFDKTIAETEAAYMKAGFIFKKFIIRNRLFLFVFSSERFWKVHKHS